jgi:hypothetical protein
MSGTLPNFPKKPGKVVGLSQKSSAGLSNFSKIVWQSHRIFSKKFSKVIELF